MTVGGLWKCCQLQQLEGGKREARSIESSGKTRSLAECSLMRSSGTVCSLSILEASTREESSVGHDTGA